MFGMTTIGSLGGGLAMGAAPVTAPRKPLPALPRQSAGGPVTIDQLRGATTRYIQSLSVSPPPVAVTEPDTDALRRSPGGSGGSIILGGMQGGVDRPFSREMTPVEFGKIIVPTIFFPPSELELGLNPNLPINRPIPPPRVKGFAQERGQPPANPAARGTFVWTNGSGDHLWGNPRNWQIGQVVGGTNPGNLVPMSSDPVVFDGNFSKEDCHIKDADLSAPLNDLQEVIPSQSIRMTNKYGGTLLMDVVKKVAPILQNLIIDDNCGKVQMGEFCPSLSLQGTCSLGDNTRIGFEPFRRNAGSVIVWFIQGTHTINGQVTIDCFQVRAGDIIHNGLPTIMNFADKSYLRCPDPRTEFVVQGSAADQLNILGTVAIDPAITIGGQTAATIGPNGSLTVNGVDAFRVSWRQVGGALNLFDGAPATGHLILGGGYFQRAGNLTTSSNNASIQTYTITAGVGERIVFTGGTIALAFTGSQKYAALNLTVQSNNLLTSPGVEIKGSTSVVLNINGQVPASGSFIKAVGGDLTLAQRKEAIAITDGSGSGILAGKWTVALATGLLNGNFGQPSLPDPATQQVYEDFGEVLVFASSSPSTVTTSCCANAIPSLLILKLTGGLVGNFPLIYDGVSKWKANVHSLIVSVYCDTDLAWKISPTFPGNVVQTFGTVVCGPPIHLFTAPITFSTPIDGTVVCSATVDPV